jgi:hypothetical protein
MTLGPIGHLISLLGAWSSDNIALNRVCVVMTMESLQIDHIAYAHEQAGASDPSIINTYCSDTDFCMQLVNIYMIDM